jgi:2-iminobutanoate/2-iminopropanoate deaminase
MKAIDTGLPSTGSPMEWATVAGKTLYTAQIPIRADGSFETGDIRAQTELTLKNLVQSLAAAGLTTSDVAQVTVYLTDVNDKSGYNDVYRIFFTPPYPNRATIIVAALGVPGMRIEIVAQAVAEGPASGPLP